MSILLGVSIHFCKVNLLENVINFPFQEGIIAFQEIIIRPIVHPKPQA